VRQKRQKRQKRQNGQKRHKLLGLVAAFYPGIRLPLSANPPGFASPSWNMVFFQVVKRAQSRGRTERTLREIAICVFDVTLPVAIAGLGAEVRWSFSVGAHAWGERTDAGPCRIVMTRRFRCWRPCLQGSGRPESCRGGLTIFLVTRQCIQQVAWVQPAGDSKS
jgi:hypothetical protein